MKLEKGLAFLLLFVFVALFFPGFQSDIIGGNTTGPLGEVISYMPLMMLVVVIVAIIFYGVSERK